MYGHQSHGTSQFTPISTAPSPTQLTPTSFQGFQMQVRTSSHAHMHACMHAYASQRLEAEKERREGKILRGRVTIARAHELTFTSVACSSLFDQNTLLRLLAHSSNKQSH